MPNRAERRAQARRNKKGIPSQYDQSRGHARSGLIDESQLQQRSEHLQNGDAQWKPSSTVKDLQADAILNTDPSLADPKLMKAPHSTRQVLRICSWVLIVLSVIAFFVVMWIPSHPMAAIITVSAIFVVAVLSLFFTAGNPAHNPNLDEHGTAV